MRDGHFLSDTKVFDDVVHILITTAGQVDQHRAGAHGLCQLHAVSHGVGALDGRDDALFAGQLVESVDGLLIVDDIVFDTTDLLQEGVLGTGGGIVQT